MGSQGVVGGLAEPQPITIRAVGRVGTQEPTHRARRQMGQQTRQSGEEDLNITKVDANEEY